MKHYRFILFIIMCGIFTANAETVETKVIFPSKNSAGLNKPIATSKATYIISIYNNGAKAKIFADGKVEILQDASVSLSDKNYELISDGEETVFGMTYYTRNFSFDWQSHSRGKVYKTTGKGSDTVSAFGSAMINAVKKTSAFRTAKRKKKNLEVTIFPASAFQTLSVGARVVKLQANFVIME